MVELTILVAGAKVFGTMGGGWYDKSLCLGLALLYEDITGWAVSNVELAN